MGPHIQIFLRQTVRSKAKLCLNLVLLAIATAFFVMSINLFANSAGNLRTVENTYTSIATMEFWGYVNEAGELVHPGDETSVGWKWLSVEDFDLSPLLDIPTVTGIDLRTRVGAYIPGHSEIYLSGTESAIMLDEWVELWNTYDVIRFVLDSQEPLTIALNEYSDPDNPFRDQYIDFPIRILEQRNSLLSYPERLTLEIISPQWDWLERFSDEIRRLNRSDCADRITLYPGVEYVITCSSGDYWIRDEETGRYVWQYDVENYATENHQIKQELFFGPALKIVGSAYYETHYMIYNQFGFYRTSDHDGVPRLNVPFAIQRYEDVKDDPQWNAYAQASIYESQSFSVTLTQDISRIPAWYQGAMFLNEGRMITQEEYNIGAKVCMVSAKMAAQQGWQVGDTLEMHLYASNYYNDEAIITAPSNVIPTKKLIPPIYNKDTEGFFEEDTYTIVGIFGQKEFDDFGETSELVYYNPHNAIYIPANAAPNAPAGPIQPSLITVYLKNGGIATFQQTVEALGLTDFNIGEYQIKFSYFDQGYSKIKPGLDEMNRNAVLLLSLSSVLLLTTMVLLAFLFSQGHKHSAGILRVLGGSKRQAVSAILTCAGLVGSFSSLMGTILGGKLTDTVGARIAGDTANISRVALHVGINPALTVLTGLGCIALFLMLTALFTAGYIGKEPRQLLPQSKA